MVHRHKYLDLSWKITEAFKSKFDLNWREKYFSLRSKIFQSMKNTRALCKKACNAIESKIILFRRNGLTYLGICIFILRNLLWFLMTKLGIISLQNSSTEVKESCFLFFSRAQIYYRYYRERIWVEYKEASSCPCVSRHVALSAIEKTRIPNASCSLRFLWSTSGRRNFYPSKRIQNVSWNILHLQTHILTWAM